MLTSKQKDCTQWIIETAPKNKPWSANRVVHELMALWFGSVHILTTVSAFDTIDWMRQGLFTENNLDHLFRGT